MTDTLKSTCEQCVHLLSPQLNFIPEEPQRHRELILRDLKELVSAACLEHTKTVVILAGCLIESILFCFLQSQISYITLRRGAHFSFNPDYSLGNYVSIFNRYFSTILIIPPAVVAYRDMVHIHQELQFSPEICRSAAVEMLQVLDTLLGKLTEYVS